MPLQSSWFPLAVTVLVSRLRGNDMSVQCLLTDLFCEIASLFNTRRNPSLYDIIWTQA